MARKLEQTIMGGGKRRTHHLYPLDRGREAEDGNPLQKAIARVALERHRADSALQSLTGKLLEAQEEERRRIARELHDGLNQQLAMLAVELGMLARRVRMEDTELFESIMKLRQRTEGLSNDVRLMTHQLHPAALEHLGLVSALRGHCAEKSQHDGIDVEFTVGHEPGQIPGEVAICLYRIVQEALGNTVKHSGAREAKVHLTRDPDGIRLSITDAGSGFSPNDPRRRNGLGLISIKERVQIVSGKLIVQSAPGKGTRIEVQVPITWKEHAK
jgi:signal transduction histidine kinase